ncbi:hypothetical protein [Thalassobacillus pellis]|uniref:hypothetical protein n=1 Tax=Thalassobacillus pellis TaxID=748008 RepID=UPI001960FDF3|nr:hypothetical protein [Thalassobacillus pellis]MBM7553583.1 hypothetical protein [Thalassobacillus pellis]
MEKFIVKIASYGFICSLAIGILLIDYTVTFNTNGSHRSYHKDLVEYILEVLRFSIKGAIALTAIAVVYKFYMKYKQ